MRPVTLLACALGACWSLGDGALPRAAPHAPATTALDATAPDTALDPNATLDFAEAILELGVYVATAEAQRDLAALVLSGHGRKLAGTSDSFSTSDGVKLVDNSPCVAPFSCLPSPWTSLIMSSVAFVPTPAPPAAPGLEPSALSTYEHRYLVENTVNFPRHGIFNYRTTVRLTEYEMESSEEDPSVSATQPTSMYEMSVEENMMVDNHGSPQMVVGKSDLRQHKFFYRRSPSGEIEKVLYHQDEKHAVLGSKRAFAAVHQTTFADTPGSKWTVKETDATGDSNTEYRVHGGRGFLRPNRIVHKKQWYGQSAAVPDLFEYDANTTSIYSARSRMPTTIRQSSHFRPEVDRIPSISAHKTVAELDQLQQLPKEPTLTTWTLLSSKPLPAMRRRRLSESSLRGAGFVEGPLKHPPPKLPTVRSIRQRPEWKAQLKRDQPGVTCDEASLKKELSCIDIESGNPAAHSQRAKCMEALKLRDRHCPQLLGLMEEELLSVACSDMHALRCGALLAAHSSIGAGPDTQRVLAAFLSNTTAGNVPIEAHVLLATAQRPAAVVLEAVLVLLRGNRDGARVDNWTRVELLMPAAGAVYHARHAFGRSALTRPKVLSGRLAAAAAEITSILADELHATLAEDAVFQFHHEAASKAANHTWEHKLSLDERDMVVGEYAQVASHEGVQWERDAGRYDEHAERVQQAVLREKLLRRPEYDPDQAEAHERLLSLLLRATGNLGLAPEDEGGKSLLANTSACLGHRSEVVSDAATDALRRTPHPDIESTLRGELDRPHTERQRVARTAALDTLTYWHGEHISSDTVSRVVGEFVRMPKRTVEECKRTCRAARNPHLIHHGEYTAGCEHACNHEKRHAQALLKLLLHAGSYGHDVSSMVDLHLEEHAVQQGGNLSARSARYTPRRRRRALLDMSLSSADLEAANALANKAAAFGGDAAQSAAKVAAKVAAFALQFTPDNICLAVSGECPQGSKYKWCMAKKTLCIGIDIILGHSPIVKGKDYKGPTLPLIGAIGFEWGAKAINQIWARIGIFDGGFGLRVEDVFFAEFYLGKTRIEVLAPHLCRSPRPLPPLPHAADLRATVVPLSLAHL